jgi:phage terminase small subunit
MAEPKPEPEPENPPRSATAKRRAFALALARGLRIGKAAEAAGISERTASRLNKDPAIGAQVAEIQRAMLGRAMGRLAAGAELAAAEMVKLIKDTGPAATTLARLAACRAVLADLTGMRYHLKLSDENAKILRRLDEHDQIIKKRKLGSAQAFNGSR